MSALEDLVLTDEEVCLLAKVAGRDYFPGATGRELDDAGWEAVGRTLIARGVLRPETPPAMAAAVDELLGVVLRPDHELSMTLVWAPGAGENSGEVLWFRGDAIVRQITSNEGIHRFRACDRGAVDRLLATTLDLSDAAGSQDGPPRTLSERDFFDALMLSEQDGLDAAVARFPAVDGYLQALGEARRSTYLTARVIVGADDLESGDDDDETDELTLVESARHGLWLERSTADGDGVQAGVVLRRITVDTAREQVTALVGKLA